MPTFVDEGGNTGTGTGASLYFRLATVWVAEQAAEPFREVVRLLRVGMGLRADYEFKFHGTGNYPGRRQEFFVAARAAGFRFVVASIDKRSPLWAGAAGDDYQSAVTLAVATALRPVYLAEEQRLGRRLREPVLVDDNADRRYLK